MKKVIGYVVAVVGLVVMTLGFNIIDFELEFLKGITGNYIAGVGVVLIVVGVVLSLRDSGSGRAKQAKEEVPIYEGVGKKRKIVGYRKD